MITSCLRRQEMLVSEEAAIYQGEIWCGDEIINMMNKTDWLLLDRTVLKIYTRGQSNLRLNIISIMKVNFIRDFDAL